MQALIDESVSDEALFLTALTVTEDPAESTPTPHTHRLAGFSAMSSCAADSAILPTCCTHWCTAPRWESISRLLAALLPNITA